MRSTCLDWGWRPPVDFDYTWTSLGRFALAAVDELGLDRFHLVVHDIGGPVGFEVAAAVPERVKSLTVLNSPVEVDRFRRPWVMEPFAHRGVGRTYLRLLNKPVFRWLMGYQAVADRSKITNPRWTPTWTFCVVTMAVGRF